MVNNTRYVLFPWVRTKNLASKILGLSARRLSEDWNERYGYRPVLLETFVHADRHAGTCYRAANRVKVGETKGRGRMDRDATAERSRKLMFVHPLVSDVRVFLTRPIPGTESGACSRFPDRQGPTSPPERLRHCDATSGLQLADPVE